MQTIILGVAMFIAVVVALILVLLAAKAKLVSSAEVVIDINEGEKVLKTPSGSTLLDILSNNKLFIPSACGGKGSCGVCKVHIHEGGGSMLPTETGHISRGEAKQGCRLACQVKVKGDMHIELEPEVFSIRKWTCKV